MTHSILSDLKWRYATKKFDSSKKVDAEQFEILKNVLRLTPSSYGLQPYKFLLIENPEIRKKLQENAHNQSPITEASHLILFCLNLKINSELVASHVTNTAHTRQLKIENLKSYEFHLNSALNNMQHNEKLNWAARQAYIALGHLIQSAAQLKIDCIALEGFDHKAFDEVLGLEQKSLQSLVACAIGYRSTEDKYQYLTKVRRSENELFETI